MDAAASVNDPVLAHFAGIILAATLGVFQGRSERMGLFWMILFRLPGTILHELAHLLVAFTVGGKPTGFSIIPRRMPVNPGDSTGRQDWVLGSVTISNPSVIAAMPSGLAPLILIPFSWFLYRSWFVWFPDDLLHTLFMHAVVVVCCCGSIPSSRDISVAFSRPLGVVLYALLGGAGVMIWRGY